MATIRAYTTIEQSCKLAEILPVESADMYYPWYIEEDGDTIESGHRITTPNIGNFITHKVNKMILPCWSLATLLSVLPYCPDLSKHTDDKWYITTYPNDVHTCLMAYDNPIDACVATIEKLHELKML